MNKYISTRLHVSGLYVWMGSASYTGRPYVAFGGKHSQAQWGKHKREKIGRSPMMILTNCRSPVSFLFNMMTHLKYDNTIINKNLRICTPYSLKHMSGRAHHWSSTDWKWVNNKRWDWRALSSPWRNGRETLWDGNMSSTDEWSVYLVERRSPSVT